MVPTRMPDQTREESGLGGIFREDRLQTDGTIKRIQRKVVLGPCNKYLSALRMLHFSLTWMPSTLPLHQPRK